MKRETSFKGCFTVDLKAWYPDLRFRDCIRNLMFNSGYFAVICYRLARYFSFKKFSPLNKGLPFLPAILFRLAISRSGCEINYNADIDKGLIIDHSVGIVIRKGRGWAGR